MNPKTIADVFKNGRTSPNEAMVLFIHCAMDNHIEDILREISEALREDFEEFVATLPEADCSTIKFLLKKEWILGFKSYYQNRSS